MRMRPPGFVFALLLGLGLAGSAAAQEATPFAREGFHGLYVLSFNRGGELVNPADRDLAIEELSRHRDRVDRIIIFSYGWANDGEASYATYTDTLTEMMTHAPEGRRARMPAVIAVGWDSSTTGVRKLLNDLIPLPVLADTLAWLPDKLLFPISFWSKASQADRIGFGGLRTTLNHIMGAVYPEPLQPPEIYLIGHSFGTRIISGLMRNDLAGFPLPKKPFTAAGSVKGAVLLQPALVPANLDRDGHYPIMVTQSRHDSANGFLYPLANSLVNAYSYTTFESLIDSTFLSPLQTGIQTTVGTVTDTVTGTVKQIPIPRPGPEPEPEPEVEPPPEPEVGPESLPSRAASRLRRGTAELVSIPFALAFGLVTLPVNYVYAQGRGLVTRPVDHVMDTLAQLPVVEVPVWALDRALGREVPWGTYSKGFFTLGSLVESSGHSAVPGPIVRHMYPVYTLSELEAASANSPCRLPVCEGVYAVEASPIVRTGAFGEDLENPWYDFTVGWLDLIGAHGDYKNPEVMRLMSTMLGRLPEESGAQLPPTQE